jgi:tetratricopeptide (TPR) repeat protein
VHLGALDYAQALVPLLSQHADGFAGQASFLCEGAVPQLLGMLHRALGQRAEAQACFERGIAMNEGAGFAPRAAEAQAQLAGCLLESGRHEHRAQALELATKAHASALRLGMQRLALEAADLR